MALSSPGYCLKYAIPDSDIFIQDFTDLYVSKSDPKHIAIGPIYGNYIESFNSGDLFRIIATNTNPITEIQNSSLYEDYYKLEIGSGSIILSAKSKDEKDWHKTNLSEFIALLARIRELGENKYGPLNFNTGDIKLKLIPLLGFILIGFLSVVLNNKVEKTKRNYHIQSTLIFFGVFYYVFIFVLPEFCILFQTFGFKTAWIPNSTLCLLFSSTSYYGLFFHTITIGFFSPCIFFQLKHILSDSTATFLKGLWICIFLLYGSILNIIIFGAM